MKKPYFPQSKAPKEAVSEIPSLDTIEAFLQDNVGRKKLEVKDFPQPVITTNTYMSNFITNSAVPFVKERLPEKITLAYAAVNKDLEFDFFTIPPRRFLLLNTLKMFVYPQYGTPAAGTPARLTSPLGDNELFQFSFGFNLVANQINNALLLNQNFLDEFYLNREQILGYYYTFNQNVYTGGTSLPAYALYGENQKLVVKINWTNFPTTTDFPPVGGQNFTGLNILVYAGGYLLNATDYYRFLDSVVAMDLKGEKKS